MKKVLTLSLLALFVSHGALATNYALNNDNIALSFDDANSTVVVKDNKANHPLTPQELFFLTLPDETKSTPRISKSSTSKSRTTRLSSTLPIRTLT
jgi:hypothetical protein